MATIFATHPLDLTLSASRPLVHGKPLLRGRLHQLCCGLSIPAGASLVGSAATVTARVVAARLRRQLDRDVRHERHLPPGRPLPPGLLLMRRADHSMIFVHIAGAATPLCVLAVPSTVVLGPARLGVAGPLAGVITKATRLSEGCKAGSWLYLPLGWALAVALPFLAPMLGWRTGLLVGAGVAYSVGAVLFFRKRPDPVPTIFGYHEVWHCFTAVGGICQFLAIQALVTAA